MVDWLFESGRCALQHNFERRELVRFAHGSVHASMEEVQIFRGIWLYRGEATGDSRFNIDVAGGSSGQGRVILGSMLSARGVMTLEGCDERSWREDGKVYAFSPIERRMRYEVGVEKNWRTIAVRLETDALDVLGADPGLPDVVRAVLECRRDDLSEVGAVSGALRAVSHSLMRSPYEGSLQVLYRQGKVLEMLAHLFDGFSRGSDHGGLTAADQARARQARERLLADLRQPPALEALALDVGLTPKRLNRCFRQLYGTTVFDFLRDARLDAARAALDADTPLSLKQLAWELGYGQVSNFVTAFRRRFGYTPGVYRRGDG